MALTIRKLVTFIDETRLEGGRPANPPLRLIGAAAVIRNPWAGRGFVENLRPEILEIAPLLGQELVAAILSQAGSGDSVEAYGKAAVVGTMGEVEHASAMIHTLRFGNLYRDAVGAKSYLSFSNVRGGPGNVISIPMMHKHDAGMRSHYLTLQYSISDAPAPDEIVVALGAATGGRPNARIGDRYQDMAELKESKEKERAPA
ncbi:MAG: amino acid synthesis family protein [Alphaproteobacteria bacterium]|nr:amino acid synthesis family protein [Alphaproteobacteria bacterium]